ncbi:MAG: hypothetical protein K2N89_10680 [Lachnospiraceae bacterium]|nr:hypothetical protein [Lachnospiraceae bacterium]
MKRLPFKNGLFVVIMLAVLLTGCSNNVQTEDTTLPDMSMSSEEETQAADEQTEEPLEPSFANLTLLETKPELDGNVLLYGNLRITLPDGVTVEQQEPDGDAVVMDFIGAETIKNAPFPPRIWLANYDAEYNDSILELISVLLDLLPGVSLCERYWYRSSEEHCYLYTYDKPYKNGYVLIYNHDVYIVEEVSAESDYSFGNLLDNEAVQWKKSTCTFGSRSSFPEQIYSKVNAESDLAFFVAQTVVPYRMQVILLYQDGYFSTIYQNIVYEEWGDEPVFEDCNFDGYLDMVVSNTRMYLWNAEQKEYVPAQIPKDFPKKDRWNTKHYPETKTIWSFEYEDVKNADGTTSWGEFDNTEILWKWEGTALVKKRECVTKVRETGVHIQILSYEGSTEKVPFDEIFTTEEWKRNTVNVQKRYQQFYAGMLPEENDNHLHKIDYHHEHKEYIPQALLEKIANAMLDGTESETLKELVYDKELTKDAVLTLAKDNLAMRCDVIEADRSGDYIMVMADADNDGIMDIVAEEYFGGSGIYTEYVFYKGQKDGTYQKTSSYDAVKEEFAIITYDGKKYLCRTLYDDSKKKYIGFCVAYYVDGVQVQATELTFSAEKYDIRLTECAGEKYRAFAENIYEKSLSFKEMIDKHIKIDGSSEEKLPLETQYRYQCDLDNDGEAEQYNKYILESNMGTYEKFHFNGKGEEVEYIDDALRAVEGTPTMMWVEPLGEENIVNVISSIGLHDFEITGFLLNGAEYTSIYRITAEATYGVNKEIFTHMERR